MDENASGRPGGADDGRADVGSTASTGRAVAEQPGQPEPPDETDGRAGTEQPVRRRAFWRELPVLIGIAFVLSLLFKTFLVQPFYIPSPSMENTLRTGDRILVDKVSYRLHDVRRGDIVVFNGVDSFVPEVRSTPAPSGLTKVLRNVAGWFGVAPPGERDFVKRVIGVAGDHVVCCDDEGRIAVNGVPLREAYLHPRDVPSEERFDVRVPAGKLWVMGDHRSVSQDSRAHLGEPGGGFVPTDRVIGRAAGVIWPLNHFSTLPEPAVLSGPAPASRHRG